MLVNGKKVVPTVYTLVVYEQEFGSNMLQDLFSNVPDFEEDFNPNEIMSKVDWLACIKCLWAIERTADDSTPSFVIWSKTKAEINFMDIFSDMLEEVSDAYFHPSTNND